MKKIVIFASAFFFLMSSAAFVEAQKLTIVLTSDLHSHLLGFAPNIDYSPLTTDDDVTVGGWARLATVIENVKKSRENPVLVLDAGDFLMGSLFHLLCREEAFELGLLKMMGYDVLTLGNHEFDLRPQGLARILSVAADRGDIPLMVASNVLFSKESDKDDALEELFNKGVVKPYSVIEKNGHKFGVFGLLGKRAAEVAPFASPATFSDPIETAKRMVTELRQKERVDRVILLSHSGFHEDKRPCENEIIAKEVAGIDVIIAGHTHASLEKAVVVNGTTIVQAGAYGKYAGVLDMDFGDEKATRTRFELKNINDSIAGDPVLTRHIAQFESIVHNRSLRQEHLEFREMIAQTDFDLRLAEDESNLGNLIADSIRWYVNQHDSDPNDPDSLVTLAVISNGVIRDDIVVGKTGKVALCDAFRAIPLGIGVDDTMGYPLISFYLYASEIKKGMEILTSIYPMKGSDYFLQLSGAKFVYNPNRLLFDRVTDIWIGDEQHGYASLDYSSSNKKLYRVSADIYNATFLKIVGNFTWQILRIVPKDRKGNPIEDLKTARVDADKEKAGVQELKEWQGLVEYLQSFEDVNGDGVADIPAKYREKLGRIVIEASWNPYKLLKHGSALTWVGFVVLLVVLALVLYLVRFFFRKMGR